MNSKSDRPLPPKVDPTVLNDLILRSIVDHAIVTLDADGFITSWNEGAERILGWREEEIVGRHGDVFFTPEDVARSRPETEMRLALENGRGEDERWHVRKNGERFWGSGLMMPLLSATDAEGDAELHSERVDGFVKIFRDRTLEHQAKESLTRLENRAALAMRRSGTVGVYDFDLLENIVVSDRVCAELHSVPVELAASGTSSESFFEAIHPDEEPAVRRALAHAIKDGRDLDELYRIVSPDPRPRWLHSQAAVQRDGDDRPARLSGIVTEVTAQRELSRMQEARLRFSEEVRELSDVLEIAHLASRLIGETLYARRAGHGYLDDDGDTIDIRADWNANDGVSLVGRRRFSDFGTFATTLSRGEAVVINDARTDDRVSDSAALEAIGARALVNLPLMEGGRLKAVLFVNDAGARDWSEAEIVFLRAIFDRTYAAIDRVRYEAERDMMTAELAHRMKNMLAIAQVVVTQSLRRVEGLDQERGAIAARLGALSHAQDILTRTHHQAAGIRAVIETTLRPYQAGRIVTRGPDLLLQAQQVLGLSLVLHELGTNAAKHGALSKDGGRVELVWSKGDGGQFSLRWSEHEGPPVTTPDIRGFGSTILDRVAGNYFDGVSQVAFSPHGVVFTIEGRLQA